MEWMACLTEAIGFMEDNLTEIRTPDEVADHVHVSCMYLQRGFQVLTGYTLGAYMRNRKLYLAAVELTDPSVSVTDVALKYGYETPASFDKAFVRFHGATPMDVRKSRGRIRSFQRLSFSITVQGGEGMQFRIDKKEKMTVGGFQRVFDSETAYDEIPAFWNEITGKYAPNLMKGLPPEGETEKFIAAHRIGQYGVCIDDAGKGRFSYLIAGGFGENEEAPEGMAVRRIEAGEWAVFDCTLETLQQTNTAIWKEWVPGNGEYEPVGGYNVEWYDPDSAPGPKQKCQIWIPVSKK